MKKDRKTAGKLTLHRETLRKLNDQQLQGAAGGGTGTIENSGSDSCAGCASEWRVCYTDAC